MLGGHIAEEGVDVGKGADVANAVKWSPARLRGLEVACLSLNFILETS